MSKKRTMNNVWKRKNITIFVYYILNKPSFRTEFEEICT